MLSAPLCRNACKERIHEDDTTRNARPVLGAMMASGLERRADAGPTDDSHLLHECFIAGFRYHDGSKAIASLHYGDELDLFHELENVHDRWAVRVAQGGHHLGYLPRSQNQPIARLLQQGAEVRCRIARVDRTAPPWEAVRVRVTVRFRRKTG